MERLVKMSKIVIVGCGNVGMSYAYSLINQKCSVDELVLIDKNMGKAEGEAMDLNHSIPYSPNSINIKVGNYNDCSNADIVVLSAGANQEVGETRLDLIHKNDIIFKSIINSIMESGFNGIFLIATNPVDAMSYITYKYSGLDSNKVIGTGTSLDTARLRYMLSKKLNISPKNVHAYVMGEHGDSEFIAWSTAMVGTINISDKLTIEEKKEIGIQVRDSAYDIIKKKGNTSYGIGTCLLRITNAILNDENSILTVSTYQNNEYGQEGLYIGVPAIINKNGVKEILQLKLNKADQEKFNHSCEIMKENWEKEIKPILK